jgi:hypothetical protein
MLWEDSELPLTYEFQYLSTFGILNSINMRSENQIQSSRLPATGSITDSITVFLNVYDDLNSVRSIQQEVTVLPQSSHDISSMTSVIADSEKRYGQFGMLIVSTMISEATSRVNCSLAPANCSNLNRYECSSTPNSCGSCYSGYIGASGDANSMCIMSVNTTQGSWFNKACSSNSQCPPWSYCSDVEGRCLERQKQCTLGCSSNGECVYIDLLTRKKLLSCNDIDTTCVAHCVCSEGFSGASCSLSTANFELQRKLYTNILESIVRVSPSSSIIGRNSIASMQGSILISIISDPQYFLLSQADVILGVQKSMLRNSVMVSVQQPLALVNAVSSSSALRSYSSINNTRRLSINDNEVERILLSEIQSEVFNLDTSSMAPGQFVREYVFPEFAYSFSSPASNTILYAVSTPVSSLQPATSSSSNRIELNIGPVGESTKIGLIAMNQIAVGRHLMADALQVIVNDPSMCGTHECSFKVKFPYYEEMRLDVIKNNQILVAHCLEGVVEELEIVCASGVISNVTCFGVHGVYNVYCQSYIVPSCKFSDVSSDSAGSGECSLDTYTNLSTTFNCSARDVFSKMQLEAVPSIVNITFSEFIPTYTDDFLTLPQFAVVFGSIIGFSILSLAFAFYGKKWRKVDVIDKRINFLSINTPNLIELHNLLVSTVQNIFYKRFFVGALSSGNFFMKSMGAISLNNEYTQAFVLRDGNVSKYLYLTLRTTTRAILMSCVLLYINIFLYGNNRQDECWKLLEESACVENVPDTLQIFKRDCMWQQSYDISKPNCVLASPDITVNSVILLSVITCVVMSLINVVIDHIFNTYLLVSDAVPFNKKITPLFDDSSKIVEEDPEMTRLLSILEDASVISRIPTNPRTADSLGSELLEVSLSYRESGFSYAFAEKWGLHNDTISYGNKFVSLSPQDGRAPQRKASSKKRARGALEKLFDEYITETNNYGDKFIPILQRMQVAEQVYFLFLLFFWDMLGRRSETGRLFEEVFIKQKMMVSTIREKNISATLILLLNAAVMSYSFYLVSVTTSSQSSTWINGWLFGSFLAILIDLLYTSRVASLFIDFIVVHFLQKRIEATKELFTEHLQKLKCIIFEPNFRSATFSTSHYFFVSTYLAHQMPEMNMIAKSVILPYKYDLPSINSDETWHELLDYYTERTFFQKMYSFCRKSLLFAFSSIPHSGRKFVVSFISSSLLLLVLFYSSKLHSILPFGILLIVLLGSFSFIVVYNLPVFKKVVPTRILEEEKADSIRNVSSVYFEEEKADSIRDISSVHFNDEISEDSGVPALPTPIEIDRNVLQPTDPPLKPICSICDLIVCYAHKVVPCEHLFCLMCIRPLDKCPICSEPVDDLVYMEDFDISALFNMCDEDTDIYTSRCKIAKQMFDVMQMYRTKRNQPLPVRDARKYIRARGGSRGGKRSSIDVGANDEKPKTELVIANAEVDLIKSRGIVEESTVKVNATDIKGASRDDEDIEIDNAGYQAESYKPQNYSNDDVDSRSSDGESFGSEYDSDMSWLSDDDDYSYYEKDEPDGQYISYSSSGSSSGSSSDDSRYSDYSEFSEQFSEGTKSSLGLEDGEIIYSDSSDDDKMSDNSSVIRRRKKREAALAERANWEYGAPATVEEVRRELNLIREEKGGEAWQRNYSRDGEQENDLVESQEQEGGSGGGGLVTRRSITDNNLDIMVSSDVEDDDDKDSDDKGDAASHSSYQSFSEITAQTRDNP